MTTSTELQALERKLKADISRLNTIKCENSLAEFTRQAWHIIEPGTPLVWNWHLDTLCAYLEATMDRRIHLTRLIINIPPGSMKSVLVSVMFPAWMWIKNPQKRVLGVSNSQDLAIRDSRRTKQIVTDEWYTNQWPVEFTADQSAKTNYENTSGGFRVALGITANITGKRGDVLLLDDIMDASTAQSDLIRKGVLDIYDTKLSTRVNSQRHSVIILIMQRLHACLPPYAPVITDSGKQSISSLKVGDIVLTSKGFEPVKAVSSWEYSGELVRVSTFGNPDESLTTPEHLYRTKRGWVEAADLLASDWIGYAKPFTHTAKVARIPDPKLCTVYTTGTGSFTGTRGTKINKDELLDLAASGMTNVDIGKKLGIHRNTVQCAMFQYGISRRATQVLSVTGIYDDPMFYRVLGYWIAEGAGMKGRGKYCGASFTFHENETKYHNEIVSFFENRGINVTIENCKDSKAIKIMAWSSQFIEYCFSNFGSGALNKTLPGWVYSLNKENAVELIRGWTRGDASFASNNGTYRCGTVSWELSERFSLLLASIGVPNYVVNAQRTKFNEPEVKYIRGRKIVSSNRGQEVRFYASDLQLEAEHQPVVPSPGRLKIQFSDSMVWKKVKSVSKQRYSGAVHDIETEAHDFVANGMIVHNSDITGHLLNKKKTRWTHVVMPMHYDSAFTFDAGKDLGKPEFNDPRKDGELLFPALFPVDTVEKLEEDMGTYACTPAETPILMADKSHKRIEDVEVGDMVMGYNITPEEAVKQMGQRGSAVAGTPHTAANSDTFVPTRVTETFMYPNRPVLEYAVEDGSFVRATRDHNWYKYWVINPSQVYSNIRCFNRPGHERKAEVQAFTKRPPSVIAKVDPATGEAVSSPVKHYTHRGRQAVYALTTETGNYIAWDHVSSNSAGQLEQRPSPKGGGIMREEWFRVLDNTAELPVCEHIFISCDTAYSEKDMKNNSYSAFTTWGVFWNTAQQRDCILLLDVWFDQVDYPELRRHAHKMDREKKPDVWLIEKKASGQCHDDKTQVLTDDGWKLFKDVDYDNDLLHTKHLNDRRGEYKDPCGWQKAIAKVDEYYSGDMYRITSGTLTEMLVTPNHRVLTSGGFVYAKHLTGKEKIGQRRVKFTVEQYSGRVYCAQVPDETLFTRRVTEVEGRGRPGKQHGPNLTHTVTTRPMWSGNSLVQDLRQSGLMVRTYVPTTDKVSRAYAIQPMLESGQVWIPDRKWAHVFAYQMGSFPTGNAASFDLADTCTQALLYIRNGMYVSHPDDLEHDRPEVRRLSAYGAHSTQIDKDESPKSLIADSEWRD